MFNLFNHKASKIYVNPLAFFNQNEKALKALLIERGSPRQRVCQCRLYFVNIPGPEDLWPEGGGYVCEVFIVPSCIVRAREGVGPRDTQAPLISFTVQGAVFLFDVQRTAYQYPVHLKLKGNNIAHYTTRLRLFCF